jgi:putative transposase
VIVLGERHLKWILKRYFRYYLDSRTHLSLKKDAPNPRTIQSPETGNIVQIPEVGLHHRYERRADAYRD